MSAKRKRSVVDTKWLQAELARLRKLIEGAKPAKAKPRKPTKAKPAKAKPTKAKPTKAKPAKAKPRKPTKAKPAKAKPTKAKPTKAKPRKPTKAKPRKPTRPTKAKPRKPTKPAKAKLYKPAKAKPAKPRKRAPRRPLRPAIAKIERVRHERTHKGPPTLVIEIPREGFPKGFRPPTYDQIESDRDELIGEITALFEAIKSEARTISGITYRIARNNDLSIDAQLDLEIETIVDPRTYATMISEVLHANLHLIREGHRKGMWLSLGLVFLAPSRRKRRYRRFRGRQIIWLYSQKLKKQAEHFLRAIDFAINNIRKAHGKVVALVLRLYWQYDGRRPEGR
jgi:hypothetical protein